MLHTQPPALYDLMSSPIFIEGSNGFLQRRVLWRAARPIVVLISAVVLAALAQDRAWRSVLLITAASVIGVLIITVLGMHINLEAHPIRAVYVFEIEVMERVIAATVVLAVLIFAMGNLTERYQSKISSYFVGLVAGAAVGYFSKEIFKSSDNESWFSLNFQHKMNAIYKPFFYRKDPARGEWIAKQPARWRPDGMMSDALSFHQYKNELGEYVSGWSWKARMTRAKTLQYGLRNDPEQVQISLMNDTGSQTANGAATRTGIEASQQRPDVSHVTAGNERVIKRAERIMTVQFPEKALNTSGTDILSPLKDLQQGLGILPDDTDLAKSGAAATFTGPPDSVAIIEAGATALSKWWSVVIAGLGGAAVITSAVTRFWSGQTTGIRIGLIGGMAGLVVAAVIAISVIVAADVKGRALGMVALYTARASIATQFLQQSLSASRSTPVAAQGNPGTGAVALGAPDQALSQGIPIYLAASGARALVLHKPSNQAAHLAGVRQLDDGTTELFLVRISDQQTTWCAADEVTVTEFTYPVK